MAAFAQKCGHAVAGRTTDIGVVVQLAEGPAWNAENHAAGRELVRHKNPRHDMLIMLEGFDRDFD
jgi:hypothetical protein